MWKICETQKSSLFYAASLSYLVVLTFSLSSSGDFHATVAIRTLHRVFYNEEFKRKNLKQETEDNNLYDWYQFLFGTITCIEIIEINRSIRFFFFFFFFFLTYCAS